MAIDAVIVGVTGVDGTWKLTLEPRGRGTVAGQHRLTVLNPPDPPERLEHLIHIDIWGNSSQIMVGEEQLASREGYTGIRLSDGWSLIVKESHEKRVGEHPPG